MGPDSSVLPAKSLSPLARRVERILRRFGYEVEPAIAAVNGSIPGYGGLFDPETTPAELRTAIDRILETDAPHRTSPPSQGDAFVLYVDGSARSNPGPAGAGAVILDAAGDELVRLGRPVGSRADNNTAEYVALQLGLAELLHRYDPAEVEIRIDSMTVIRSVWGDKPTTIDGTERYAEAAAELLTRLPTQDWTHLVDSDPNPADALATFGADVAEMGPGG